MQLRDKYLWLIGIIFLVFIGLSLISWLFLGEITLILDFGIVIVLTLAIQFKLYFKVQEDLQQLSQSQSQAGVYHYSQIESLFSIFSLIKINHPLPAMRGWSISPDFAKIILELILETKPKLIVEASTGVSTLIAAYCLKSLGRGTLIALEEDKKYAEISNNNLIKHGLQDIATVIHAPLKEVDIEGKTWLWYDTEKVAAIQNIDLLIIDGPVQYGKEGIVRYPAIPILIDSLSDNAVILLDDADRKSERQLIKTWIKDFDCFQHEHIETEKGAAVLRRVKAPVKQN